MRPFLVTAATFMILFATGCPPAAIASTWDDFKSKQLNPAKWVGDEFATPGAISLEARREIVGGKLLMSHRAAGDGGGVSTNRLVFRNSSRFTSIQYTVKVNAISTTDCSAISVANISQFNFLFNTDDASIPGCDSVTCNVFAIFYMDHVTTDGPNIAQVHSSVVARPIDGSPETLLGLVEFPTVKKGAALTVALTWDDSNNKVTFDVTTSKKVKTTRVVNYGVLNKTAVVDPLNTIEVSEFVCGPGGVAESSSSWDSIVVTP